MMTTFNFFLKKPRRKPTFIFLLTATGAGLAHHHYSNLTPAPPPNAAAPPPPPVSLLSNFHAALTAILRSSRAICTIGTNLIDYKCTLHGLAPDSDDYRNNLSLVHLRSATRILKLCQANKGFYTKAGQFVAALRQVPLEYSSTLSSLHDQAVPYNFQSIEAVLINNLGNDLSEIFLTFNETPIAAASIAQVHQAVLKDGHEVAIKVQYPDLELQLKLDTLTMSFLSRSVAWLFPEYRFDWAVSEFVMAISSELDFIQEAKSSERTAENFKNKKIFKVPRVFWEYTTNKVLTMELCKGNKVDDVEFLKEIGVNPVKVAKSLIEIFAEMIFIHGFLHGDPHPGNVLVSPGGPDGFSLVLLDHGIYRELDNEFRKNFCQLWYALLILDSKKIQQLGERFGVGQYSQYFPLIFTGRTIDSQSAIGRGMTAEEKTKLKTELKTLKMEDISSFMGSLPPDFLAILRTEFYLSCGGNLRHYYKALSANQFILSGLLKSIASKLGASQRIRLLAYAKYALSGISSDLNSCSGVPLNVALCRIKADLCYLELRLLLGLSEVLSWFKKVGKSVFMCICSSLPW